MIGFVSLRTRWIALAGLVTVAALLSAWFAVNGPKLARGGLQELRAVALPEEAPPLPPGVFTRSASETTGALARRSLFAPAEGASPAARANPPDLGGAPTPRGVVAPPSLGPRWPSPAVASPEEQVRIALAAPRPGHEQYFGGHLIPDEDRISDLPDVPGAEAEAPTYVEPPRRNPRLADEEPAPDVAEGGAPEEAEVAAADPAAAIGDAPPIEGLEGVVLLGVFQSRGAERALVRTATGENVRVRPGDDINGWSVAAIGEDFIRVRRASQTRLLRMPQ